MRLCMKDIISKRAGWEKRGYVLPAYDRGKMIERSVKEPVWIHFGAGNIFRAFPADCLEELLNSGAYDRGVAAVSGRDRKLVDQMYRPHDNLSILVTLKADGCMARRVIGSVSESLGLDFDCEQDLKRLREIFSSDSLQMASFTITEKGYALTGAGGMLMEEIASDMENGPEHPVSYMGRIVSLLYTRYLAGEGRLALVSMDNCSRNGDRIKSAVRAFAMKWEKRGTVKKGFLSYAVTSGAVTYPCTMIDKIVPRPDPSVLEVLQRDGLEGLESAASKEGTFAAPFVNAEEPGYLVIEDDFPNGRPPLEKAGVIFTDSGTVDRCEHMKVCTCLNPMHTALAIFGCLLGYTRISEEMKDPQLRALCEGIGYREGLPVVTDPGILDPKEFIDTFINERLPNPYVPDSPQRIATDTSQKIPVRFGETLKAYMRSDSGGAAHLICIPLVFAGWLRYLMAVDDSGCPFERSADPMLDELTGCVSSLELGNMPDETVLSDMLHDFLGNEKIFGVSLHEAGLSARVVCMLREMGQGTGAVRRTLEKYTQTAKHSVQNSR